MKRLLTIAFVVTALMLSHGCGSDSDGPTEVPSTGVENASLAVGTITSIGRVEVNGLPAAKLGLEPGDYTAVMSAPGAEDIRLGLNHDSDGWYFTAPFHPLTPNEGGMLQVRITDGELSSEEHVLEVSALPASPGSFASVVATMRTHLEQRAQYAGTSIAELKATLAADVADDLLPLKLSQAYLDSDLDPNDLTDLVANSDDFLSAEHVALLDRVFGFFDLEQILQLEIDAWNELPSAKSLRHGDTSKGGSCISVGPAQYTAPELSIAMVRSAVAQFGADPNSVPGRMLANGAKVLTVMSAMPSVGVPAGVAGVSLGAVQGATEYVAGTLPSSFDSIQAEVGKPEFNEDSDETTTYKNVKVVAASTGWSADKSIANVVINSLGTYLSAVDKAKILDSSTLRDITSISIGVGASELFDGTGIIEFCARQWTVDISSPLYCTAASIGHKFDVNIESQIVTPKEVGTDQLLVAAQSAQFGGRKIEIELPMEVKAIEVDVTPVDIYVDELGTTVSISAAISNADLTTLRWTALGGAWNDGLSDETNDGGTRPLITSSSEDDYPIFVTVESLSRNGLRSSGLPARIGHATIRYIEEPAIINVTPHYVCISPGETQQFEAEVIGIEDYTVVWKVTEGYGSIDQNGLYQSLSGGTSDAVIRAHLEDREEVYDESKLDAAACNCSFDISIFGGAVLELSSSQIAYQVSFFEDYFYQFYIDIGNDDFPGFSASVAGFDGPAPQPGETGTWRAAFSYITGSQTWNSSWDDELPLSGVSLTITEFADTYMVGRFHGNIYLFNEDGSVAQSAQVDAPFRAGRWGDGGWPCE